MDNSHLLWRLRNNETAKDLCRMAAEEIERLNALLFIKHQIDSTKGCPVCGIGADGQPMGYVCGRNDCPIRVTT